MKKVLLKICGITSVNQATACCKIGADMIGIVFYKHSKRYVDLKTARNIARATKYLGRIPVGVFMHAELDEVVNISKIAGIETVQLHNMLINNRSLDYLNCIYANSTTDVFKNDKDFLLFDNVCPGSGKTFSWENFSYQGSARWFLAGGLNPDNVAVAITRLHPYGVDVSTGVETSPGIKDLSLVEKFIQRASMK